MVVALYPVPLITRSPGDAIVLSGSNSARQVVTIDRAKTYPVSGYIELPTVSVSTPDAIVTLPQVLLAYLQPSHHVVKRNVVYPLGIPRTQSQTDEIQKMQIAQRNATVAALKAAGVPVRSRPAITQVAASGPAYGKLAAGDLITAVNGTQIDQKSEFQELVGQLDPGTIVKVDVVRAGNPLSYEITTVASQDNPQIARIGIEIDNSYDYDPEVHIDLDRQSVGPSAGLALSLIIYDQLTEESLIDGRKVAASGAVSANGEISPTGGARQKLKSADIASADIVLIPAGSCADIEGLSHRARVVKVTKLDDAISSLTMLKDPQRADRVPTC